MATALTAENTSRYADANGVRVHYHEAGDGPPLVCVAATAFGASAWGQNRRNLDALSRRFRTMLVNLPPQGDSDKQVKSDEPRLDFYARVLRDFLDALGIDRAHFYGGSPGAGPVLKLAVLHPERVDRIVVDAPTGLGKSLFNPMPVEGAAYTAAFGREPTMERLREVMEIQISRPELREEAVQLRYAAAHAPGYQEARGNISGPMEGLAQLHSARQRADAHHLGRRRPRRADGPRPRRDVGDAERAPPPVRRGLRPLAAIRARRRVEPPRHPLPHRLTPPAGETA